MSLILIFQATYPVPSQQATWSLDDLPRAVACTMHQGSSVVSMDFHPFHHTLLVGKLDANLLCQSNVCDSTSFNLGTLQLDFFDWLGSNFHGQLVVEMVKLHYGMWGCVRGWFPSHSRYGICQTVLWCYRLNKLICIWPKFMSCHSFSSINL